MFPLRFNVILMLALLNLVACGGKDSSSTSQNASGGTVQLYGAKVATNVSSLPTCDSTQIGQLFFVLADEEFKFCSTEGYQAIDLRGEDGNDGSNGSDGYDGADGKDGSSCSVIANKNTTKTILCEDGTTATLSDGASCEVADNGDGSYDLTCSGTTVTVRDGKDGQDGSDGINGKNFLSGTGIPALNLGANGDTYLDTYRTAYYLKTGGSWVLQSFDPSRSFQDSRDDHVYKKVTIGTQTWMAENLAYLPSVNAKADSSSTVAKYYVYDYDSTIVVDAKASSYYTTYGVLYNWPAAMAGAASTTAEPSGVKGVCPTGWHLPSRAEWDTLVSYVGDFTTAGGKLKSVSGWATGGEVGTDAYGFSALPGGYYYPAAEGFFHSVLNYGSWLTATEYTPTQSGTLDMSNQGNFFSGNYRPKFCSFAVRCLLD